MKNVVIAAVALLVAAGAAHAGEAYTVKGPTIVPSCYVSVWMPGTIEINPQGRKIQDGANVVIGDFSPGTRAVFTRSPAVYMQTTKVVQQEYTSLVPTPCVGGN